MASPSCADLTSCHACATRADLVHYDCHWCALDSKCHAIGSLESKCVLSNDCVSLSHLSSCGLRSVDECPIADATPEQIHLALSGMATSGSPNGIRVAWWTPKAVARSVVQYGQQSHLDREANGTSRQYLANYGHHHRAALEHLRPGATYFYRVGDGEAAWSTVLSFVAPHTAPDVPVRLSVFGDMGYLNSTSRPMQLTTKGLKKDWSASYTHAMLRKQVEGGSVDGVWHLGDIGYTDDSYSHAVGAFSYEQDYNGYMRWLQPIASRVPYMVAVGNHESECHSPACITSMGAWGRPLSNFSAYNARFAMPFVESAATSNMWYSFNLGPLHAVVLNTETDWEGASEESTGDSHVHRLPAGSFGHRGEYLAWLEADLAQADAARRRGAGRVWIVAGGHRPLYEIEASHGELLRKYHVDAYFSGHDHEYRRKTHTFADNSTILTVVVGGAGCDEMAQGARKNASGVGQASYVSRRYASGVLRANATALTWGLLDSEDGSVLDEVVLTK